jgi:hypothetical protein
MVQERMNKFFPSLRQTGLPLVIAFLILLCGAQNLGAQNWFVDQSNQQPGTGDGTLANPFKTLKDAVNAANAWGALPQNANIPKTIQVASGTYAGEMNIQITTSFLTITGNPGSLAVAGPASNAPILDGLNATAYLFNIAEGVDNIRIQGFFIRNYAGDPSADNPSLANVNGTAINVINTINDNSATLVFNDNEFENVTTAIFLASPGSGFSPCAQSGVNQKALGGVFNNLTIQYNVVKTADNQKHAFFLENISNATIAWNQILGNNASSGNIGLEISIRNNTQCTGATPEIYPLTCENITIANNIFLYNRISNLIIGNRNSFSSPTFNTQTVLRNVAIDNNTFTNSNTDNVFEAGINRYPGGRLINLNYIDTGITQNVRFSNFSITNNTFNYQIANGSLGRHRLNSALWFRDIQGFNTFSGNTFTSVFQPLALTVANNSGDFNGLVIDYGQVSGSWQILRNSFAGHDVNKPNDIGAAIAIYRLGNASQSITIQENYITRFKAALAIDEAFNNGVSWVSRNRVSKNLLANISLNKNHLAGNKIGVANHSGGLYSGNGIAPAFTSQTIFNASLNWWGDNNPQTLAAYVDGGQSVGGTPGLCVAGTGLATGQAFLNSATPSDVIKSSLPNVDYSPWLDSGADTEPNTPGFQPDLSYLHVDRFSPQSPDSTTLAFSSICPGGVGAPPVLVSKGSYGRVGEALENILPNGTIFIHDRGKITYYNEGYINTVTQSVKFDSDGAPIVDNLRMQAAPESRLTLLSSLHISQLLDLQSGKIDPIAKDIIVVCMPGLSQPIISGGNVNSYVLTTSTGALARDCIGGSAGFTLPIRFPVGTNSSYAPVTLQNISAASNLAPDRFSVRVAEQVTNPPGSTSGAFTGVVKLTWYINETCPNTVGTCVYEPSLPSPGSANSSPNNNINLTLQWNAADEGVSFNRTSSYIQEYTSNNWIPVVGTNNGGQPGVASGAGPYTRTVTGLTGQFINKAFAVFSDCPSPPIASASVARCDAGPVTFTLAYGPLGTPAIQPNRLYVYDAEFGGLPIATFSTSPATFTSASIPLGTSKEFWVAAGIEGGCESRRVKVNTAVASAPSAPIVSNATPSRCGPGVVTFTASMGALTGSAILLVSDPANPNSSVIASASSPDANGNYFLATPLLSQSANYGLIVVTNATPSCTSVVTPVTANIVANPAPPTVANNPARCGAGLVTLSIQMGTPAGNQARLYTLAVGGTPVATAAFPFELTASASATTTWFVEAFQSANNCVSASRTPVTVTVSNENIAPPSATASNFTRCGSGQVTMTVLLGFPSGNQILLYDSNFPGGNLIQQTEPFNDVSRVITAVVTTNTTYYLAARNTVTTCESNGRFPVTISVLPGPGSPLASSVQRCGPGLVVVTAFMGSPAGTEIRLYSQMLASTPAAISNIGPSYQLTIANLTTTSIYYVASANPGTDCESVRVPITATVNPIPAPPTVPQQFRCQPSVVTFTATMEEPAGTELRMYDAPAGGALLAVSTFPPFSVTSGALLQNSTTYWFSSVISATGCQSPTVASVANINVPLSTPTASGATRCGAGNVTISATMGSPIAGNVMRLFTQPIGGSPIATDDSFPFELIAPVATSATFFVESFNTLSQCSSASRAAAPVTVIPGPGAPLSANLTRCGTGRATFTASMTFPLGTEIRLYTQPLGGFPVAVDNASPYLLETPNNLLGVTSYYMAVYDLGLNCESSRTMLTVTAQSELPPPTTSDVSICGSGPATFTVTLSTNTSGSSVRLYTQATGGNPIAVDSEPPFALATPALSTTTTYYIENFSLALNCASNTRIAAVARVQPIPASPLVPAVTRCQPGVVTFTIQMGTPSANEAYLYTVASGGAPISADFSAPFNLETNFIAATSTFYVEAVNTSTGCVSARVPAVALVAQNPGLPTANNVTRCQNGTVVFTVNAGFPAADAMLLYTTPIGGTPIFSDTQAPFELLSAPITTTATFFIESFNTSAGCRSVSRTPVVAIVNTIVPAPPTVSPATRCGAGSVDFIATQGFPGGTHTRLYLSSVGGTPISETTAQLGFLQTPVIQTTTTFYAAVFDEISGCESPRTPVVASVILTPGIPIVFDLARCGTGQVTFTVTMGAPAGSEIRMYESSIGGTPIASVSAMLSTLVSPFINTTTTFYFSSFSATTGCESPRQSAVATVHPVPGNPSAPSVAVCGPGQAVFNASMGFPAGDEIRLYDAPSGAGILAIANAAPFVLVSPFITTSTAFYLEAVNTSTGCVSLSRTPVLVSVNSSTPPALPTSSDITRCGAGVATFTATMGNPAGNQMRIYDAPSGGTLLGVDNSFPFELAVSLSSSVTYYISAYNTSTGCESSRLPVVGAVVNSPSMPQAFNIARCGPGPLTISASMGEIAGNQMLLYATPQGGTPLLIDPTFPFEFSVNQVNTNTTYYVAARDGFSGCEGPRSPVSVIVNPLPSAPSAANLVRCGSGGVIFSAVNGMTPGTEIRLFDAATGGGLVASDDSEPFELSTPELFTNTTYYIESFNASNGCRSARTAVTATIHPGIAAPNVSGVARCGEGRLTFTATFNFPAGNYMLLYDQPSGGNLLATDLTAPYNLTTPILNTTSTFYVSAASTSTGCQSERVAVTATIHPALAALNNLSISRCGAGTLTITPSGAIDNVSIVRVFNSPSGGVALASSVAFPFEIQLNNITNSGLYYLEAQNLTTGCVSPRSTVNVTILPIPGSPITGEFSRCGSGSLTITALAGFPSANEMRVYDALNAASPINSSQEQPFALATPVLFSSTVYYLALANTSTGCESARVPVALNINPIPGAPSALNVTRCGAGTVSFTAQNGNPSANRMRLYDALTATIPIAIDDAPPFVLSTGALVASSQFFLEAENTITGCVSSRVPVTATVNPLPNPPAVENISRCNSGNGTFTLAPDFTTGARVALYASSQSSAPLSVSAAPPFRLTTPMVNTTTTFYVTVTNVLQNCESEKTPAVLTINPAPGSPVAGNVSRCGAGRVTFTVQTGFPFASSMRLYTQPSGGSAISSAGEEPYELTSSFIATTTTFFVEALQQATGCISSRTPVVALVNSLPSPPQPNEVSRCGAGPITLTASMGNFPGNEIRLYAGPTDTQALSIDPSFPYEFSFNNITTTTTFYVEAFNSVTGCSSAVKTEAAVRIQTLPSPPSAEDVLRCGGGESVFTAVMGLNPGTEIRMYNTQFDGVVLDRATVSPYTLRTPAVNTTTTFYLAALEGNCESAREAVVVNVRTEPTAPVAENVARCGLGSVTFTGRMGGIVGSEIRLFTSVSSTIPVSIATEEPYLLTVPNLTATSTFYMASVSILPEGICTSDRVPVIATINPRPAASLVQNVTRCGVGPVTFTVNRGAFSFGEVRLYSQATGGIALAATENFPAALTTETLTATTTFYIANAIGNCESQRIAAVANVRPQPGAITIAPASRCGAGAATFTAEAATLQNSDIRLYDSPEGGNLIAVANVFPYRLTVPFVTTTTTFYASNYLDGCETNRVEAIINVINTPPAPRARDVSRCRAGAVTFTPEFEGVAGVTVSLFSAPSGGNPLVSSTSIPFFLEVFDLTTTTTYYIGASVGSCNSSSRGRVVASIEPPPSAPTLSAQTRCGSGLVTITAQMGSIKGAEVRFYDANGALLSIATTQPYTYSTFINGGSQNIFASVVLPGCESERTSITVFSGRVPSPPQASNFERCGGGNFVTLTAFMGPAPGSEIRLYNAEQGGSIVAIATAEPYLLTIPGVVSGRTLTYYISSAINTQEGSCESSRVPVTVTLNSVVAPPTVSAENRCGAGSVVFTVSHGNSPNTEVRLYTQLTAISPIRIERGQNLFITSPPINSVTTFYFSTFAGGCESERTRVVAAAIPTPGVPASQDIYLCGPGAATFTVTPGTIEGTEYHLYNTEESTVPIAIATQPPYRLTVPLVNASATYYIQAVNNSNLGRCSSPRVGVRAILGQVLSAPSISPQTGCGASSFTFNLNPENIEGAEVRVYSSPQGGLPISVLTQSPYNFVTRQLTTSTTYYYSIAVGNCQSRLGSFEARITPIPRAPVVSSDTRSVCGAGQVTLTLQANQSNTTAMRLYDSAGNRLETFNGVTAFYTTNITTTTSFLVSALNENCEGPRESITIVSLRTSSPPVRSFAACAGETVSFSIDDNTPNREYRLYRDRNSSFILAVANRQPYVLTTPPIQTNTTFYLTNFENNCESERSAIEVSTTFLPSTPVVQNQRRCGSGPVTLTVAMGAIAGTSMRLYDAAIGGNLINETFSFPYIFTVTPPIGTFTYYVSAASGKCESSRVAVSVTAGQEPSAPAVQSLSRCGAGVFTFTAQMGATAGQAIRVYEASQGGAPVATLNLAPYLFTTPVLSSGYTYYFASVIGACESPRVAAVASVTPQPSAPLVSSVPACGNEQVVTFTVNPGVIAGEVYRLYTTPSGFGAPIVVTPTSQNFITVNNPTATTYYISAANGDCESPRVAISRILGNPPIISFSTQGETCFSFGSISASASGGSGGYNFELYRGPNLISSNRTGQFPAVSGGAYRLVVRDNNGCFAEVNATVAGIPTPVFTANASVTSSSATVNWSAVPGVQGYILEYRSLPTGVFITLPPLNADQTGVTISGLQANTLYEARVRAVCTGGRFSDYSNPLSFQTSGAASSCSPPSGLSALPSETSASLSWEAVSGAIAYNITYQRLPDGSPQQVSNVSGNSFNLQGLAPNAEYLFRVQAICSGGITSAFSAGQSFVTRGTAIACAIPQNVRGEAGSTDILVAWNSVATAISYTLQYRELPNGAPFFIDGITSTSQLITGLEAGKSYEARVRANCGAGVSSEYSSGSVFITSAAAGGNCGVPPGLGVQFRSGNVAILSWQPVSNALCYIVSVGVKGESPDTWIDYLVPAPATSLEVFNLIPGREYSARIRSNCSLCSIRTGLRSPFSGVLDFRMAATRSSVAQADGARVEAYPNPTTGSVQINFTTSGTVEPIVWEAIDVNGKALLHGVWEPKAESNLLQLDFSSLPSGVYIVKLKFSETVVPLRIIKN